MSNSFKALKRSSIDDAFDSRIDISGTMSKGFSLIPIGPWVLSECDFVKDMAIWRQRSMKFFLTQFESTTAKTLQYLESHSIAKESSILFAISSPEREFVGHVGFQGSDTQTVELDNLMLGRRGLPQGLMLEAEKSLVSWGFEAVGFREVYLRVLSFNFPALELHKSVGFCESGRSYLRKVSTSEGFSHKEVSSAEANVGYSLVRMSLANGVLFSSEKLKDETENVK